MDLSSSHLQWFERKKSIVETKEDITEKRVRLRENTTLPPFLRGEGQRDRLHILIESLEFTYYLGSYLVNDTGHTKVDRFGSNIRVGTWYDTRVEKTSSV